MSRFFFSSSLPRAVVFDLDGTLVDTEDIVMQATRHAIRRHLTREFTDDELWALYGRPVQEVWTALGGERAGDLHDAFQEFYGRHRLDLVRPFPGVLETVEALAQRGVRLGLLSNKLRADGLAELATAGLDGAFEVQMFVEDMRWPKPDASGLLTILERLGVQPGAALMVGDGPMDILCGQRAGAATGLALWARQARGQRTALEQLGPDHLFMALAEILPLFPAE